MIGVSTYPYSRTQSSYREDFEQLVASTITHPYISTTNMGQGSCPHNLLTGAPEPAPIPHPNVPPSHVAPALLGSRYQLRAHVRLLGQRLQAPL